MHIILAQVLQYTPNFIKIGQYQKTNAKSETRRLNLYAWIMSILLIPEFYNEILVH